MQIRASAEVFREAFLAMDRVRRCTLPFLNAALENSSLATLQCTIRYTPIVMPEGMRERYPARSKLREDEHLYDCSPQLNFEVFVDGAFEDQVREYLRGMEESVPFVTCLGGSPKQVAEFEMILASAVDRIVGERPDQNKA